MVIRVSARRVFRIAGFAAITAAMLPVYSARDAMASDAERDPLRDRWTRRWSNALLRLFDVDVVVVGEVPPKRAGRLVVSNHRSTIDIAVILRTFGGRLVSRGDLSKWPLVGSAATRTGTVFVDRDNKMSGAAAIRAIFQVLRAGATVAAFPEGTTFPDDRVRTFQAGAFVAAVRAGAEVVPVGIAYETGSQAAFVGETFKKHLARMAGAPPTRLVVCIGTPIDGRAFSKGPLLAAAAQEAVSELIVKARALVDRAS